MSLFDDFSHYVDIYGPPESSTDAGGGVNYFWPTLRAGNVPCLFDSNMAVATERFEQEQLIGTTRVVFRGDAQVFRGDLLVVKNGPETGVKLRVVGIHRVTGFGNIDDFLYATGQRIIE